MKFYKELTANFPRNEADKFLKQFTNSEYIQHRKLKI
jgi:hypothetical protein